MYKNMFYLNFVYRQIQFLSLAENGIGHKDDDSFLALAYAASASQSITVMDLTRNFRTSGSDTVHFLSTLTQNQKQFRCNIFYVSI